METFLPWLYKVSWWLCASVVTRPFHLRKKEITKGKRLEIIAGPFWYLKKSIRRKSFEGLLFMLHSSSSDRWLNVKAIDGLCSINGTTAVLNPNNSEKRGDKPTFMCERGEMEKTAPALIL